MSTQRELMTRAKEALEVARESNTDRYFLYSNLVEDIDAYLSRPEPISHEPPCGWRRLNELFIQKASYLCTAVDWDDEHVNFEYLAQLINYGETALRECLEHADGD